MVVMVNMMTMPVAMAMTVTKVALIIMINADSGDAGGANSDCMWNRLLLLLSTALYMWCRIRQFSLL